MRCSGGSALLLGLIYAVLVDNERCDRHALATHLKHALARHDLVPQQLDHLQG